MDGEHLRGHVVTARFSDGSRAEVPLAIIKTVDPEAVDTTGAVDGPVFEICLISEQNVGKTLEKEFGLPSGVNKKHRIHH